jgi:hypothetical protein
MRRTSLQALFQGFGDPIADRTILLTCLSAYLPHEAERQLHGKNGFRFGNGLWAGEGLGSLNIPMCLPGREPGCLDQASDDLRRGVPLLQPLMGLIHTPDVLDGGRPAQLGLCIILFVTYRQAPLVVRGFDPVSSNRWKGRRLSRSRTENSKLSTVYVA